MGEINLSLSAIFEQVWGYKTTAFEPELPAKPGRKETGLSGSSYYTTEGSVNGREYFMPVLVTYPDYSDLPDNAPGQNGGLGLAAPSGSLGILKQIYLPYPVISIRSSKTIIQTPLTERRGTVKEFININDYEITIKGFVINKTNDYPEETLSILRDLNELGEAVQVACPALDLFLKRPGRKGSDHVVISSFNVIENRGVKNVRPYEMTLISDEPFNLIDIR